MVIICEAVYEIIKSDHTNKSFDQGFPVVLFTTLNTLVPAFENNL